MPDLPSIVADIHEELIPSRGHFGNVRGVHHGHEVNLASQPSIVQFQQSVVAEGHGMLDWVVSFDSSSCVEIQ